MMPLNARPAPLQARWTGDASPAPTSPQAWAEALASVNAPLVVLRRAEGLALAQGEGALRFEAGPEGGGDVAGWAAPCPLERLGSPDFCREFGLRYPYIAGAMANGIGSAAICEALAPWGMMGVFGAGGLGLHRIEEALDRLQANLPHHPWGANLIHSPYEPGLEEATVALYLQRGVTRVTASAFLGVTPAVVRYRVAGLTQRPDGTLHAPQRLLAKISRAEVAARFLAPPPADILQALVQQGHLTPQEARLAAHLPLADGLIAEADSGGHTDNRPALVLLPEMLALRDRAQHQHGYAQRLYVGAAGGIGEPRGAAAAFAMGADFILTGSINQACREAGTSDAVRQLLAQATPADVTMAPAADMFEMGVQLQVLRRGTMFAARAQKLYDLYRAYPSLEALPAEERARIERSTFQAPLDAIWAQTRDFWSRRDPDNLARAEADPKHRMALVFRWYLGMASRWANAGEPTRRADYQIWCGPSMGAFNAWVQGSSLEPWEARRVAPVALNLLHGAAMLGRLESLRRQGVHLPEGSLDLTPRSLAELTPSAA